MLINRTLKLLFDSVSINEVQSALRGEYGFIGDHRNNLRSFVLNTILDGNDSPMRRLEIAMDFANGFGLFMISQFSSERRDVIRSQTVNHFKNHCPLLIDIVLDSNSESVFAERMSEWISNSFSSWIYKLSLQYPNRLEGVKKLFTELLIKSMGKLAPNRKKQAAIPQFVGSFVDKAKAFHFKAKQKEVAQQQKSNVNGSGNTNTSYGGLRMSNTNEQWVCNLEESERSRWIDTIRCDQKRIRQNVLEMKQHRFSKNYLPTTRNEETEDPNKKGGKKK